MFVVRLLPFVQSLGERKWSDEDIVEDIDYLKEELKSRLEGLTWVPAESLLTPEHTTSTSPRLSLDTWSGLLHTNPTTSGA